MDRHGICNLDHLRLGTPVHGVKWHHQLDMFVPYNLDIFNNRTYCVGNEGYMLKCQSYRKVTSIRSSVDTVMLASMFKIK